MTEITLWLGKQVTEYKALVDEQDAPFLLRMSMRWSICSLREPDGVPRLPVDASYIETKKRAGGNLRMNRVVFMLRGSSPELMEKFFSLGEFDEFYRAYTFIPRIRALNKNGLDCRFLNLTVSTDPRVRRARAQKVGTMSNYYSTEEEKEEQGLRDFAQHEWDHRAKVINGSTPEVKKKLVDYLLAHPEYGFELSQLEVKKKLTSVDVIRRDLNRPLEHPPQVQDGQIPESILREMEEGEKDGEL